ncbi:MAG TPA: amidase [Ramlibacter sp.]|nr:amidase [Ramlibacter sp.]
MNTQRRVASPEGPATSLRDALDSLRQRRVTATDLALQALHRAAHCNEALHAFSVVAWDHALKAAADSDRRLAEGSPRVLEGLPIAVKDLIDTRAIETRYGSPAYRGHVPAADAEVVRVLTDCGAIVIGKTTTHEFAWGVTTASADFGDTLHPLDPTRIPGGSSGGMAAAIAGGAVAAGIGTDTGGSVRIPAALCGVVGFKPTFETLPTRGIFPLAPSLDHPGLLGATVDDVLLLAQPFGLDLPENDAWLSARFGVIRGIAPVPLEEGLAAAFDAAIAAAARDFQCEELHAPSLFEGVFAAFGDTVLMEGGVEHFKRHDWDWIEDNYGTATVDRLRRAMAVTMPHYAQAQQARRAVVRRLERVMADLDFLLLPTVPCIAPRRNEDIVAIGTWSGSVREALMTYTAPFNMAGFPAITIPLTSDRMRLPAGLQIVARPGDDGALLQIAQQLEQRIGGGTSARPMMDFNLDRRAA